MKSLKRMALVALAGLGIVALGGCASKNEGPDAWSDAGKELDPRYGDWIPVPGVNFPIIYFAYNSDKIEAGEKSKLDTVSNYLRQNSDIKTIIEGHCDERGSEEYNRALGERRAITVKNYLMKQGATADRLRTVSYGKDKPAVLGHDEAAWSKNRRDELLAARSK